jgi:hypothetical protein
MGGDNFFCDGYRVEMTLWNCIENQLSIFCLPAHPCHTCPAALIIRPAPKLRASYGSLKGMSRAVAKAMGLRL